MFYKIFKKIYIYIFIFVNIYIDKIIRVILYGNNKVLMLKGFLFVIKWGLIKIIVIYVKKNIVIGIGVVISN